MPSSDVFVRHLFGGGWATDLGPMYDAAPDGAGQLVIPFLTDAKNIQYELDGGPRKMGGTTKINSSALESGAPITSCFDFWKIGTSGTATQKRIVHVGTKIKADNADGVFADILTGMTSGATPCCFVFEDYLIMANDSGTDVPKKYDQTTAGNLSGSPPTFSFGVTHKNRAWAAGVPSQPSRLYYSVQLDPNDWTGGGSGSIDIDPNDGDRITGIASHKDFLFVFKGPYKGSIHQISGSTSSDFARKTFIDGLGAACHNGIFRFGDDLGFVAHDGSIRSLAATANYGDFNAASLSAPIDGYLRDNVNLSQIKKAWAKTISAYGVTYITLPIGSSATNNLILLMDFRFNPVRWSYWDAIAVCSLGMLVDAGNNNHAVPIAGCYDGYLRKLNQLERAIDSTTGITTNVQLPFLTYGSPHIKKTLSFVAVGFFPRNGGDTTFRWTRDSNQAQTETITGQGGDALGTISSGNFTLGTSVLAGNRYVDVFKDIETGGEFRAVQFALTHSTPSEDIEIHTISAMVIPGAVSSENP